MVQKEKKKEGREGQSKIYSEYTSDLGGEKSITEHQLSHKSTEKTDKMYYIIIKSLVYQIKEK